MRARSILACLLLSALATACKKDMNPPPGACSGLCKDEHLILVDRQTPPRDLGLFCASKGAYASSGDEFVWKSRDNTPIVVKVTVENPTNATVPYKVNCPTTGGLCPSGEMSPKAKEWDCSRFEVRFLDDTNQDRVYFGHIIVKK